MSATVNPGDCVRCDRKGLAGRTRGGLCWWCAKDDPTLPRQTISFRGARPSRQDLVDLRNTVKRLARGKGGRPVELEWEQVCDAYDLLRSEAEDGRGPSEEEVAGRLGFEVRTVQRRAQEDGGWPPRR